MCGRIRGLKAPFILLRFIQCLALGMLKINRLTGLRGKTGHETGLKAPFILLRFIQCLALGMLKINRLTGLRGKTGPETAGPVNRAIIQCLHWRRPRTNFATAATNFHFITVFYTPKQINICHGIQLLQHSVGLQWEHVSGLSVDGRSSLHPWTSHLPCRRHLRFHCDAWCM